MMKINGLAFFKRRYNVPKNSLNGVMTKYQFLQFINDETMFILNQHRYVACRCLRANYENLSLIIIKNYKKSYHQSSIINHQFKISFVRLCLILFFALSALLMLPKVSFGEPGELLTLLQKKGFLTRKEAGEIRKSESRNLKGTYEDGFHWDTGNRIGKIHIGGRVHADLELFQENHNQDTTFFVQRAWIYAVGKLYEHYFWKVQVDYGAGKIVPKDLLININYDRRFQLSIGQQREPFALEWRTSSRYIDFKERSFIAANIAPNRDIGAMLHGMFSQDTFGYQLGVFNGNGYNKAEDTNSDKDIAMRLWWEPFRDLHLAGAFTWGSLSKGLQDYKTSGSGTTVLAMDSTKVNGDGMDLLRLGAEFVYGIGPVRVSSEYMRAEYNDVALISTGIKNDFHIQGMYAHISWFLTGEEKRPKRGHFSRIKPLRNFNPKTWAPGAWELVAGYEWVDVDQDWFSKANLSGTTGMEVYKAGVNWYHNPMFRIMLDYVYQDFEDAIVAKKDGSWSDNEHMVWMRFALEF